MKNLNNKNIGILQFIFLYVATMFIFFWILNPHLDRPGDMLENYVWGQVWSWGNDKHPPLTGWIVGSWFSFFEENDHNYYLLTSTNLFISLYLLSKAISLKADRYRTSAAIFLTAIALPLSFRAGYKYNCNLSQLPFLAGYTWMLFYALKKDAYRYYVFAGVFAGLAMLSKYSAILLLSPITIFALWDVAKIQKKMILGLVLAMFSGLCLFAPHVLWEIRHHWISLDYMSTKGRQTPNFVGNTYQLLHLVKFISGGIILTTITLSQTLKHLTHQDSLNIQSQAPGHKNFLGFRIFITGILIVFFFSELFNLKLDKSWLITVTLFSGWALVDLLPQEINWAIFEQKLQQNMTYFVVLMFLLLIPEKTLLKHEEHSIKSLIPIFSQDLSTFFLKKYPEKSIDLVGGEKLMAYGMSFYSPFHPLSFTGLNPSKAPWLESMHLNTMNMAIICRIRPNTRCEQQVIKTWGNPTDRMDMQYRLWNSRKHQYKLVLYRVLIYLKSPKIIKP